LAKDLEKAFAGTTLLVAGDGDDIEALKVGAISVMTYFLQHVTFASQPNVFVQCSSMKDLI